eukprot:TRINITY_DN49081_c0_g1_i1.p1 TRINITY_DN49081_c0_g1~~TRINITY_DN49081_c0_g1_i1.p1  ORF type:complete len:287 (-),score=39.47 TRINITY_DN49081_c0_g1_i1:319-1086(-)
MAHSAPFANFENDSAAGGLDLAGITETSVRHGFIRKVYGILIVQLCFTTAIGAVVMNCGESMMDDNPGVVQFFLWMSAFTTVVVSFVFLCCPGTMRKSPTNYVLLSVFTAAEAVLIGFISVQYTAQSVLMVFAITAVMVIGLSLFACQTKYDFTGFLPYLFCAMLALCALGFVMWIASLCGLAGTGAFATMNVVYSALAAFIFSCYIVLDTQMIVGGKHSRYQFTVDDYCMAAINLYLDIINLFIYLLQLLGDRR